jgi:hypothetical protein
MKISILPYVKKAPNKLTAALMDHAREIVANPFRFGVDSAVALEDRLNEWLQENAASYRGCRREKLRFHIGGHSLTVHNRHGTEQYRIEFVRIEYDKRLFKYSCRESDHWLMTISFNPYVKL